MAERAARTDVAAIYIVIWFEHHGNRLYGFMWLRNKMLVWMDEYPLDCYDY